MTITTNINEVVGEVRAIDKQMDPANRRRALMAVALKIRTDNQDYPKETAANRAPAPFYIRGRGTQLPDGTNDLSSEQLDQRWRVRNQGPDRVQITNNASYSGLVIGEDQSFVFRRIGWPNVPDYVQENRARLVDFYFAVLEKG